VTLSTERLEEIAAQHDLVLDAKTLGGTGIDANKRFSAPDLSRLRTQFEQIHAAHDADAANVRVIGTQLLDAMIMHFARRPRVQIGGADPRGLARIVARAPAFIHANLDQPLSIDKIARAAATSHRTLHRAFQVTEAEAACTITSAAHRWNIQELGRFAAW
jgi:AraC-like DNA-binding protein